MTIEFRPDSHDHLNQIRGLLKLPKRIASFKNMKVIQKNFLEKLLIGNNELTEKLKITVGPYKLNEKEIARLKKKRLPVFKSLYFNLIDSGMHFNPSLNPEVDFNEIYKDKKEKTVLVKPNYTLDNVKSNFFIKIFY